MLIQHSQPVILHRMALSETGSLGTSQALVARYRGEQMIAEAVERLDAGDAPERPARAVDKAV